MSQSAITLIALLYVHPDRQAELERFESRGDTLRAIGG
jgi:hypothetical protein